MQVEQEIIITHILLENTVIQDIDQAVNSCIYTSPAAYCIATWHNSQLLHDAGYFLQLCRSTSA